VKRAFDLIASRSPCERWPTMKRTLLVCTVMVVAAGCKRDDAPGTPAPGTEFETASKAVEVVKPAPVAREQSLVERGAYIAKAAGCAVCHTAIGPTGPALDKVFAGGLEMPDKAGTWRTPNITPDKSSGIGSWTDDQIAAAIRDGVRPDGTGLYAIMPFMNYQRMTDTDVKALVAFLRTVKPVQNVVLPNKGLKMMTGPAPASDDVKAARAGDAEDPAKRGAYLASIMLCSHCHFTPDPATFAPAGPDKMFSGGLPMELPMLGSGTLYTPNITSDPETGIGKWTEDQLFAVIKTMTKPDGKRIQGPMLFLQAQWAQLDDKDLRAVAAFVHQLPPVKHKVPDSTFKPNPPHGT